MAGLVPEEILTAVTELMRRRGYGAIAMKDIVAASGAPIGSLYHYFPDGKSQIAREALVDAGAEYALLILSIVNAHTDLGVAIEALFNEAADDMAVTGFINICPVGAVAAETAGTVESLRDACAGIFTGWIDGGTSYFEGRGVAEDQARELTLVIVSALEGAFVLARTLRDAEAVRAAGRVLADRYRGVELGEERMSLPGGVGDTR